MTGRNALPAYMLREIKPEAMYKIKDKLKELAERKWGDRYFIKSIEWADDSFKIEAVHGTDEDDIREIYYYRSEENTVKGMFLYHGGFGFKKEKVEKSQKTRTLRHENIES